MWYVAIMRTDATISTLLGNLAPLWTGMLGYLFYRLKPNKYYWLGTIIALSGIVILLGYQNVFHLKVNAGFYLAISASVFYALYLLSSNVVRQSFDTVSFMMFTLFGTVFATFIYAQITEAPLWGFSMHTWLALFGMALLSHLVGWLSINYALGHIPSTEASLALLSQSICTALLASLLLGEHILFHQIVGGMIVLSGIALVYLKRTKSII
jgi:drug/metabolite transporter (DMT)-like permease